MSTREGGVFANPDGSAIAQDRRLTELRSWLHAQLRRCRLPRGVDVDDLLQETFVAAFLGRSRDTVPVDDRAARRWVLVVARRKLVDLWRRERCRCRGGGAERLFCECEGGFVPEAATDRRITGESVALRELRGRLAEALARLDDRQRRVLDLREEQRLPYARIAAELGYRSENTARQLYRRAASRRAGLLASFALDRPSRN